MTPDLLPDPALPDASRRRDVARYLFHPRQLKHSAALARMPSLRNSALVGLQSALTAVIALPLVYLSPWSHLIGFAALGVLVALFGRFAPAKRRNRIVFLAALTQVMAVLVMSLAAWLAVPMPVQLAMVALSGGVFLFICTTGKFGPPGSLIFVFASAAAVSPGISGADVLERVLATAVVAALAWVICAATEAFRHHPSATRPLPAEPDSPMEQRLRAAGRSVIAAMIAIFVSYAYGADHPAWAAMGALAVLQGAHLQLNMNRAVQRLAGTVLGALLAWSVLIQDPSTWMIIAIVALLQVLTEAVIGLNYAIGQVFVTPMALLMTHLAAPHLSGPAMAPQRVMDTLLGAVVGIAIAILLSSRAERHQLAASKVKSPAP